MTECTRITRLASGPEMRVHPDQKNVRLRELFTKRTTGSVVVIAYLKSEYSRGQHGSRFVPVWSLLAP